jgi:ferredoxin-type protein NapH
MNIRARKEEAVGRRKIRQYIMGTAFVAILVGAWFLPLIGYFIPLCMVAGISVAVKRGRQWCNWYCPRGSFADTYMKAVSPEKKIPGWLRSVPVRFAVLLFLMIMLGVQVAMLWPDPYAIGRFFVVLLTITTIVATIFAIVLQQRSWCYVCPIGSISNWVGRNRLQLRIDAGSCVDCKACANICPMQLSPYEMKGKEEMGFKGDCLKCALCTANCPRDALYFSQN